VTGTLTPSGEFSDDQKATYVVVEGTPAASPTAPTVLDPFTGSKRATVLAKVIVPISGTPTITRMNDLRFDTFAACRDEVVAAREGYVDLQARIDAITLTASTAVVTGAVQMYGGSTAPDGYLLCNGAAVSRTTYSALYSVIGTTFGTGDGSTTFNLPKITGRFPLGVSSTYMLGKTGGEETHTLTVDEMPAHTHPTYSRYTSNLQHDDNDEGDRGVLSTQGATTGSSGGGYAHNNMPPYLAMNFIIKT
ncbi:MAG TPA: tail fiber protein, partial [Holophaga sp.]|nr:tail fiber protein [Holophaga sp.]